MLDQNASTPLYEQLKNAIKKEIDEKKYTSGDRMPSEAELEKQYNVSRITVRRAIKELCDEEVLVRRQGKGTFVIGKETRARLDRGVVGFHESIRKNGRSVTSEIVERQIIKVTESYAKDLEIDPEDDVVYLKRVMYADDKPIMIDNSYIPVKRFPGIYEKLTGDVALYKMLEDDYGVFLEKYYKVLKVQKANKEMSHLLKCKVGDPMFDLFKLTFDKNGSAQIISVSLLRGEDTYYVLSNEEGDEIKHSGLKWKL